MADADTAARAPSRALLIFPCNGNGIDALDCVGAGHHLLGFVDDTPSLWATRVMGRLVYARSALRTWPEAAVLAVIGSPQSYRSRRAVIEGLDLAPQRFARVIHRSAQVSPLATIGINVLIMAGAVVTSNAVIGDHVCVLPNAVIHHDVVIGDWTLVGANVCVAGGVQIGENCYIGSGSNLRNDLSIGAGALVGLGSTVIRDVAPGQCVAGNPARPLAAAPSLPRAVGRG